MIKKCIECGNEYESIQKAGQEQKYCSKTCRNKAANKRRENNILEKFKGTIHQTAEVRDEETESKRINRVIDRAGSQDNNEKYFGISTEKVISLIQDNAYLTAENKRLTDKVNELQVENAQMDEELNEIEKSSKGIGSLNVNELMPMILPIISGIFANKPTTNAKAKTA